MFFSLWLSFNEWNLADRTSTWTFVGLENLNLQRIARTIADNPVPLQWSVTGTITEYRGANFLFVRRAVLKRRAQLPQGAL